MHVSELFSLKGKTAIITGGSRGLGLMMAEGFAEAGASLVLCSRNLEQCEDAAANIRKLGVECDALRCDIGEQDEVKAVVAHTMNRFGKIDILVNNAGISWGGELQDTPLKKWDQLYSTNVRGNYFFTTEVVSPMIAGGGGNIINIVSIGGVRSTDPKVVTFPAYASTKGAIIALTKHLSRNWAKHNIRVNAIAPGIFPTEISKTLMVGPQKAVMEAAVPLGRLGEKDDFKGAALFLAADASRYVTGSVLWVDGGMLA
ncbi:oxidoreductase, short-chain dehydrogenase/reductase family [Geobacter metallireducens GS-15]|uniref:Oxidoreductase, short-chain dehydrogenase/reductase family n=1 Tax=Geobacter metallireducens (strain ATCC 53774 / DSM 7210 / GS-15) TaxID=269799 RepID=Q39TG6_GEOMG|nr:glucose 1-dehydrogenase [Geobacter metallireducens]ABB32458.1 oxidoreductase, short-chain dehydrogenase/reductase family [Geobacter metallireducens GS-15]